jgi:phenylpyruvate tautomerase PptA (4-oxalocrotonate tautomerase family)
VFICDYPLGPFGRGRYGLCLSMFEGRSVEAKKRLIRLLFERVQKECGIAPQDLEMTIVETPKHNWGFRGLPGDEQTLSYKVEV